MYTVFIPGMHSADLDMVDPKQQCSRKDETYTVMA